ncbi:uncharacterized protein RCC_07660 [Ramularia collo-cygni]|uniref:DUF6594 domain-containing protein n=1 Tax=Ramularia collo-cygni TaxID=112498 RepID=A0A2D3VFW5_9PEZI|nr:uncharacterized protein RCC_07660 [Ramularia collo-cygni]CZT21794.1 uncharacterized protein RCC_07660 [Ramularia collo-cygni]
MASIAPQESITTQSSPEKPSIWASSQKAHEAGEIRFSGFEPCYIACIKDLEHRISTKLEDSVGNGNGVDLPNGLEELLLRYSRIVKALETTENRDRAFEEEEEDIDSKSLDFHGVRRRLERAKDLDEIYESLRRNWLLKFFGALFKRDLAISLKERFGNLSLMVDRLFVALAGGASMLVPMIIMAFATSRTARLLVTSLATIIFANAMALTSASKENVVASTAAYAAVMVVFIGSATSV